MTSGRSRKKRSSDPPRASTQVFVDGDHALAPTDCDLRRLSRLAARNAVVIADDVNPSCEGPAVPAGFCDGPAIAWRTAASEGLIASDYCDDENFCVGHYRRADADVLVA